MMTGNPVDIKAHEIVPASDDRDMVGKERVPKMGTGCAT